MTKIVAVLLVSGCDSTPPAKNFSGSWTPINSFPSETREIPLVVQRTYQASTIDITLKNMLDRWAKESGVVLQYEHPSDFVLHSPVSKIQSPTLSGALIEVNSLFAEQKVFARMYGNAVLLVTLSDAKSASVVPTSVGMGAGSASAGVRMPPPPPPPAPPSFVQPELEIPSVREGK